MVVCLRLVAGWVDCACVASLGFAFRMFWYTVVLQCYFNYCLFVCDYLCG